MAAFPTTRWSLILALHQDQQSAREALASLCAAYRAPVLEYLRHHCRQRSDAEDLTQSFFAEFIEQALPARADRARGRFRSLLLTQVIRFAARCTRAEHAAKRGGGAEHIPLDRIDGELLSSPGPSEPERAFELSWARTVFARSLARLRDEARDAGKQSLLQVLEPFLLESPQQDDYAHAARALGLSRNTVAVTVLRLRQRLDELIRAEVSETVSDAGEAESEYRAVERMLRRL